MEKKEFKTESKKILDLMINSVYSNKEIFLRELISNASDALDKLYYKSLTDDKVKVEKDEFEIKIIPDKDKRTITIIDNGIGMNESELDENLGVIAKSGSEAFKEMANKDNDINIIGQFGVGFYSAFMVAKKITVDSLAYGEKKSFIWESDGLDGYIIKPSKKKEVGTEIVLYLKDDSDQDNYSDYLDIKRIDGIIKKYSDYIKYPIKTPDMGESKDKKKKENEEKIVNSMIPIWKKNESDVKEEEYNSFYSDKFYDFEAPLKVTHNRLEGQISYDSLLFIPSHASYDYYTKEYEKGLQLYSNGVMIMEKCADLLPDYFSFVKGLVDSEDISLNISREILQQSKQLKMIAKNVEKKIKAILEEMLENDREKYEQFYSAFGMQLKYGIYSSYGMNNDVLKDLLLFYSSKEKKLVTFSEYVSRMKDDQKKIYYASGESVEKIDLLPTISKFKKQDYEVLYLTDYIDEFTLQTIAEYDEKKFANVSSESKDIESEDEKKEIEKINEDYVDILDLIKKELPSIKDVRFTNSLDEYPVCLKTEGNISIEMEKVLNSMPDANKVHAELILEINNNHPIADKLKSIYNEDKELIKKYADILYNQARLIEGLSVDNPIELTNSICELLSK